VLEGSFVKTLTL